MRNENIQVGERIKQIRFSLGETMEYFGKRFNTSKGTVNNWEKGRNLPNKENILKIAELGGMTVFELLHGNINNLVSVELQKYEDHIDIEETKKKKIFELVKKEVSDFPHLLDENFQGELSEKISDIITDVVNGLNGTNESAVRRSLESFNFSDIENMFYKTVTTNETEVRFNYFLKHYQKHYKTKKILRDGMDEKLYFELKAIYDKGKKEVKQIANENGYFFHDIDREKNDIKNVIDDLIRNIQEKIPKIARTKRINKNIEIWVHNNIKQMIEDPKNIDINIESLKKVFMGTVEPVYIDMTKFETPDIVD